VRDSIGKGIPKEKDAGAFAGPASFLVLHVSQSQGADSGEVVRGSADSPGQAHGQVAVKLKTKLGVAFKVVGQGLKRNFQNRRGFPATFGGSRSFLVAAAVFHQKRHLTEVLGGSDFAHVFIATRGPFADGNGPFGDDKKGAGIFLFVEKCFPGIEIADIALSRDGRDLRLGDVFEER
jgi:hypothetical protein